VNWGFFNMATQRVDIVVAAKDQASQKLLGITRAALGMAGAFISWQAMKRIVSDVVGEYTKAEQSEIKLATALKATGGACGFTAAQLKQYAAQLQNTTEYEDDAITEMMSMLATFKNVQGPEFTKATELILDMSKAMDQDLKGSAIQVGKALNDPVAGLSALSRVGVQFTDQQKEQIKQFIKTNDVASAQNMILTELAGKFGGQAAAAANTFGGSLKQLANDFGNAKEQMGGMIASIPGMGTAMDYLRTIFQNFKLSMNIVWTSVALGLVKFWEELKFHFTQRIPNVLVWFFNNWKDIFTTMENFTTALFENMFTNIKNFFLAVKSWMSGDGFDFKWTGLLEGFESTIKEFPDLVRNNKSEIEKALEAELTGLKSQFGEKLKGVQNPTLTPPTAGQKGPMDIAKEAAGGGKGIAAVEARFLTGSSGTDYQKITAENSKEQTRLAKVQIQKLEQFLKAIERVSPTMAASTFRMT